MRTALEPYGKYLALFDKVKQFYEAEGCALRSASNSILLIFPQARRMSSPHDNGYRLKGSSTWWAAKVRTVLRVMTVVRASDQVRQRMAWALAQIVVVGAGLRL